MSGGGWSEQVRNRWFYGFLAASTLGVIALFWPFFVTLLFAVVTVVVTWPIHARVLDRTGGRPALAAILTVFLLFFVVFGPLGTVLYLFGVEAGQVLQQALAFIQDGQLEVWVTWAQTEMPMIEEYLGGWLPEDFDLIGAVVAEVQSVLVTAVNRAAGAVPNILTSTLSSALQALIFVFAVVSLYMEGPVVLGVVKNLSPMEDSYEDRLFDVFREFANNMVLGSVVSGALQGVVAGVGYAIAGVDRVVFLGIMTAMFSFIPLVGTAVIWVPVALMVGATEGLGWGVFVAVWSMAFTASVDNVVKPLMMRGNTNIHPLMIFLAVFGGMSWMGIPGVLVGPVLVAFFLALYHIYVRDHLGLEVPEEGGGGPALPAWLVRWWPAGTSES
ncbi:MAG: AI-2E family transporter [Proteobacteria bacterium]|nr:AI-2E family transporter [Pseudomonadota bacterium]